jgi:drug/metabolite transporter (DMT)-like permease
MGAPRRSAASYMLTSALAFAFMTLFVKLAGERLPAQEIVTARAALTLIFTAVLLRRASIAPLGNRRGLLVLRGVCGFSALSCVYYAVTKLPLAEATVIQFMHPTTTALMAAAFLGEPVRRSVLFASLLGLAGAIVIARPAVLFGASAAPLHTLGLLAAVGGALLTSAAYTVVRKLGQTENALVIVFYFPLVALPASLPTMATNAMWPTAWEWLLLLAVGVCTQIGQIAITNGLQQHEAGRSAVYSYSQVLFAALLGWLVFAEVPTTSTIIGALLILSGAALNLRAERASAGA